jgi:hypothetical protein
MRPSRIVLVALTLIMSACATGQTKPTVPAQDLVRQQTADTIKRLTQAEKIATQVLDQLRVTPPNPELKTAIGCGVLKAIGLDMPPPNVTTECGTLPTRALAPLHRAVKAAEDLASCASRQNTINVLIDAMRPVWERLKTSTNTALQFAGAALELAIMPNTVTCGGAL